MQNLLLLMTLKFLKIQALKYIGKYSKTFYPFFYIKKPFLFLRIYLRTLTKHLTPPVAASATTQESISNIESMQALVNTQNEQVVRLLNVVKIISPQLLGCDAVRIENGS